MAAGLARERRPCFVCDLRSKLLTLGNADAGHRISLAYSQFCPKNGFCGRKSSPKEIARAIPLPMWTRRATTAKLKIEKSDL